MAHVQFETLLFMVSCCHIRELQCGYSGSTCLRPIRTHNWAVSNTHRIWTCIYNKVIGRFPLACLQHARILPRDSMQAAPWTHYILSMPYSAKPTVGGYLLLSLNYDASSPTSRHCVAWPCCHRVLPISPHSHHHQCVLLFVGEIAISPSCSPPQY